MKKLILFSVCIFGLTLAKAQTGGLYKNTLKAGLSGGVAVPGNNAAAGAGIDLSYQYLATNHFGIGIATGYSRFFGKNKDISNTTLKNNSFGVVPVAALFRLYPKAKGFYAGADIGYGIITGNKYVAENASVQRPDGGFYLRPQMGYHNRDWNFFVQYSKVFTGDNGKIIVGSQSQKYNAGALGIGVAYNIGLGN